ncbi:MAG TPA: alpha/beta fold hydrolase [Candidatus Limnocylindria bacterium]|nr:alpha/beta fold hydrolase [Candidatus Limnocylindria bacterium]
MKKVPFPGGTPYPREATLWEPRGEARAAVLISHGMAEHIARYDAFGRALAEAGYLTAGYNHLGHGDEAPLKGHFAGRDGWGKAVADLKTAMDWLSGLAPGRKRVLFGHSMGSFLAREFTLRYPDALDALILSGTGWHPKPLALSGLLPARALCALGGERKKSRLLDKLAFGSNNRQFAVPEGLAFDWLSRDRAEVQKYMDDPLCGFVFTAGGFRDLFGGLLALSDTERLKVLPGTLPVRLVSGGDDPVGGQGKGVEAVAEQYRAAGLGNVTVKLYEGARHELLHETNRDEAMRDLIHWLDGHT